MFLDPGLRGPRLSVGSIAIIERGEGSGISRSNAADEQYIVARVPAIHREPPHREPKYVALGSDALAIGAFLLQAVQLRGSAKMRSGPVGSCRGHVHRACWGASRGPPARPVPHCQEVLSLVPRGILAAHGGCTAWTPARPPPYTLPLGRAPMRGQSPSRGCLCLPAWPPLLGRSRL